MFSIDVSDFLRFASDLDAAADEVAAGVRPVVQASAERLKTSMAADMAGSQHFKQVAKSITYSTWSKPDAVEAEVGPVTKGATVGDLAHFAYFGGAHGGGNTVRDPQGNLDDEAPAFESGLTELIGRLFR